MNGGLFGSSGIRGVSNTEVTTSLAQRIGMTLATLIQGGTVVVGRDARTTGEMLEVALVSGLSAGGVDSLSVGLAPTPAVAWMIGETGSDSGVSITASHNPPQYNGLKIFNARGMSLTTEEQRTIEDVLRKEIFKLQPWDATGIVLSIDAIGPYVEKLMDEVRLKEKWSVACDLFCGATGVVAKDTFEAVGIHPMLINSVPDGHFPSGIPEPGPDTLKRLSAFIRETGASIGFGFDGDGDRMMALDEDGVVVNPDRLLAGYAGHVVDMKGGGTVVTHVGASRCVEDVVEERGGSVVRTRVGDASIAESMEKHGAVFGGEPVGAWIHPWVHMCPDGLLSALKLLECLEYQGETLSEFIEVAPEYPLRRLRIVCPDQKKEDTMRIVKNEYKDTLADVRSVNLVDGIRLELDYGWLLIRPSGTEPYIRITAEGRDQRSADYLLESGRAMIMESMG